LLFTLPAVVRFILNPAAAPAAFSKQAVGGARLFAAAGMYIRQTTSHVVVHAPAKVNLFLEVLARRADGYHEIETLMLPISLCDTLEFAPSAGNDIELTCQWTGGLLARFARGDSVEGSPCGDLPAGEGNIVYRAVQKLRERAGISAGAKIRLIKRIPSTAGLGGASSDAAAALVAANEAWRLGWSRSQLSDLAAELGSDIPFFFQRGAAICRGRGERIEALAAGRLHFVVVRPPVGLSTPKVYAACRPAREPASVQGISAALKVGNVAAVGRQLVNRLEAPAASLTPWIGKLRESFSRLNLPGQQMSGSGSSFFGLCRSARHARRIAAQIRGMRLGLVSRAATAYGI